MTDRDPDAPDYSLAGQRKRERPAPTGVKPGEEVSGGALSSGLVNALDTVTFGAAPALDDWLREKGVIDAKTAPPSLRDQINAGQSEHPWAATGGRAGGYLLPFAGGARLAQGALGLGTKAAGAVGAGGANAVDQAVRSQTEDKDFSVGEVGANAALGAFGPTAVSAAMHPINTAKGIGGNWLMNKILGGAMQQAEREIPQAAAGARAALDEGKAAYDAAKAARTATPKAGPPEPQGPPQMKPTPPEESLAGYAADDPLADIARTARTNPSGAPPPPPEFIPPKFVSGAPDPLPPPPVGVRPSKLEPGSPMWEQLGAKIRGEPPPAPPPPPAPSAPPGLLSTPIRGPGTAAGMRAGIDTGTTDSRETARVRRKRKKERQPN